MAGRRDLTIRTQDDLRQATEMASWLRRPPVARVVVEVPWLDEPIRQRAATRLRLYFNDCGCFWGAPVFLITLLAFLLRGAAGTWTGVGLSVGVALAAGVGGKLLGLAWSRWRLLMWLRRLASDMPTAAATVGRSVS